MGSNTNSIKIKGKIIVVVAPSGSGKSTLIKALKKEFPILSESISYTTRPKRKNDVHGKDYFFVSMEEFEKLKNDNCFLEWALVHSNYYGTSKKFVEYRLKRGDFILFDLDVQGSDAMKKYFGDRAKVIFIAPPSEEELEKRLRGRATDREEVIRERLENAKRELLKKDDYDYCVLNDDFDRAYDELKTIVKKILKD